jgi:hypothetical protein
MEPDTLNPRTAQIARLKKNFVSLGLGYRKQDIGTVATNHGRM